MAWNLFHEIPWSKISIKKITDCIEEKELKDEWCEIPRSLHIGWDPRQMNGWFVWCEPTGVFRFCFQIMVTSHFPEVFRNIFSWKDLTSLAKVHIWNIFYVFGKQSISTIASSVTSLVLLNLNSFFGRFIIILKGRHKGDFWLFSRVRHKI